MARGRARVERVLDRAWLGLVAAATIIATRRLASGNSLPVITVAVLTRAFDSLVADSVFAISLAVLALGALAASLRMPAVRIP
jgi:hypothetical protein